MTIKSIKSYQGLCIIPHLRFLPECETGFLCRGPASSGYGDTRRPQIPDDPNQPRPAIGRIIASRSTLRTEFQNVKTCISSIGPSENAVDCSESFIRTSANEKKEKKNQADLEPNQSLLINHEPRIPHCICPT